MKNFFSKIAKKTKKGFDGLIVVVGLVLLVIILIVVFRNTVMPSLQTGLNNAATEIDSLNNEFLGGGGEKK